MKKSDFDKMENMGTVTYGIKKGNDPLIGKTIEILSVGDFNNIPLILTIDELVSCYNKPLYIVGGINKNDNRYYWLTFTWLQMDEIRKNENVLHMPKK